MTTIYALFTELFDPTGVREEPKYMLRSTALGTSAAVYTDVSSAVAECKHKPLFGKLIFIAVRPDRVDVFDFTGAFCVHLGTHKSYS